MKVNECRWRRDRRAGDRSSSHPHRRSNEDGVIYGLATALASCAPTSPALLRRQRHATW